jgi:DNA polymerase-4
MKARHQRILHVDGDSFFASCEIALDPKLKGKPVYVGGGRRGDGIVIAANYIAKKYGIITSMACFEAKRKCPEAVLVRPHYDEYQRLSVEMFRRVRNYTPLLVPASIDEGYLDFTDSPAVFRCRNAAELVARMKREITAEIGLPVSMGLGSSRWLAKLATEHCKPDGFHEVPEDKEREFLHDVPIQKLAGIAERRAQSLRALGVWTLGDVAQLPLGLLESRTAFSGWNCGCWPMANCARDCPSPTNRAPASAVPPPCPTTNPITNRRCCYCSTRPSVC